MVTCAGADGNGPGFAHTSVARRTRRKTGALHCSILANSVQRTLLYQTTLGFSEVNMASRTRTESTEHKQLVKMMVNHFSNQGYTNIRADIDGYTRPEPIGDGHGRTYIPDLTCNKNDRNRSRIVLEAETCGTIDDGHTAGQWRAFARARGEFHLVVPKTCGREPGRTKAQRQLRALGITADEIWTPK